MVANDKFKPKQTGWYLFITMLLGILLAIHIFFGEDAFELAFAIINGLIVPAHLLVFLRTRNFGHLAATLYYGCLSFTFIVPDHTPMRTVMAIVTAILLILYIYVLSSKTLNWRYREILELAARPVEKSENGFSGRPFPAGKTSYQKSEILEFSRFMLKHVIAFPFVEGNRVVLVIPRNMFSYLLFFKKDYHHATHITFYFNGNITVQIAKKDYSQYIEEWTFDKLCQSLGNLFRHFLVLFQQGKAQEIIGLLNGFRSTKSQLYRNGKYEPTQ